jgi:predicted  nucleic acid-binding Zn-ribbon protein
MFPMKTNLPVIILLMVCLGLGIFVYFQNETHTAATTRAVNALSNTFTTLTTVSNSLTAEKVHSSTLEADLATAELKAATERAEAQAKLALTLSNLESAQKEALDNKTALDKAAAVIADMEIETNKLTLQNAELYKQTNALYQQIVVLNQRIADTEDQLKQATGDTKTLTAELKLLESKKQDLERRFNDLVALKDQIQTIKDNLSIARRITWMQQGVYNSFDKKGGQVLITPPKPASPDTGKSLDVELHQGGGVKINSPPATNSPSNTPAPAAPPAR